MRIYAKDGGAITFRAHVGSGIYRGHKFDLGVATAPSGELLGLPVVSWDNGTTVTAELKDIISKAFEVAGLEQS